MKIRLSNTYENVNRLRIPAGEYDIADAALCGLGQWLVDSRHAFVTEADPPASVAETEPQPPTPKSKRR